MPTRVMLYCSNKDAHNESVRSRLDVSQTFTATLINKSFEFIGLEVHNSDVCC